MAQKKTQSKTESTAAKSTAETTEAASSKVSKPKKPKQRIVMPKLGKDEKLFWKNPIYFQETGQIQGEVTPEHVEYMNRVFLLVPESDATPDLRPGKGWTLDYDPIEKLKEEREAKRRKALGLV